MKKILCTLVLAIVMLGCKTGVNTTTTNAEVNVNIDLVNVKDDKVLVTILPTSTQLNEITFHIPKTVPGTYSTDNYGKYIENLKAFDTNGATLVVAKMDDNIWKITNAKKLSKITYLVNDTYDIEKQGGIGGGDVFSPAGTNISPNNYMINTHGFIGYFSDKKEAPYTVSISHPENLYGATAMMDTDISNVNDIFKSNRYATLVDHPIMYSKPDFTTFKVDDMEIIISMYSPTGKFTAASITPAMETMMRAQKKFLGLINATKKYAILIYLSDVTKADAKGFGALEHPTSTTVVMPEMMPEDQMREQLKDIVSHEFFHIVTPLTVHSKEIHNFDFNAPKMSKHLWMYEGVTEYFANLFQVNQGLITENDFYKRIETKIENAGTMNDTIPFTVMSAKVLEDPYKNEYPNVYEKGALIAMCLDIQLRESSKGKTGILDLMRKLSNKFGVKKAFNDDDLFSIIAKISNDEKIKNFLETYVSGSKPISYLAFLKKVGITPSIPNKTGNIFMKDNIPCIIVNEKTKEISIAPNVNLSEFYTNLGIQKNDIIITINNKKYNSDTIYELINESENWKNNDQVVFKIKRKSKLIELKGSIILPMEPSKTLEATDNSKKSLKDAWLKG